MVTRSSCCRAAPGRRRSRRPSRRGSTRRRAASTLRSRAACTSGPGRDPRAAVGHRRPGRHHRRRRPRQRRHHRRVTTCVFRGFTVRNSGRQVTEEAAGITVTGNRPPHRRQPDRGRLLRHPHRRRRRCRSCRTTSSRPGSRTVRARGTASARGTSTTARSLRNRISDGRDGIYLSFTDRVLVDRERRHRVPVRAALDVLAECPLRGQRGHEATCSAPR